MNRSRCPFCSSPDLTRFGVRDGALWVRCRLCRSLLRDLTLDAFAQLHDGAFGDEAFVEQFMDHGPDTRRWRELGLRGTDVLEIGPGSGHLLAAMSADGRRVWAVETSAVHRSYIKERWGITPVPELGDLPTGQRFDLVVAINVLEHIYDIHGFLASLRPLLADGGGVFISTVNARALVVSAVKTWWSMFKEPDHVSFPSPAGLRKAAAAVGLGGRVWSGELPFETVVSVFVATRDLRRGSAPPAPAGPNPGTRNHRGRGAAEWLYRYGRLDPTSRVIGRAGRAGTVKALLTAQT
jgi:SAM-dependent methyltransferase